MSLSRNPCRKRLGALQLQPLRSTLHPRVLCTRVNVQVQEYRYFEPVSRGLDFQVGLSVRLRG